MGFAVSVEMYASGDLSDYTPAVIASITTLFAERANVGTDFVSVSVTPASVRIEVVILALDMAAAELLTFALSAVTANATAATAFLSAVPGIDITVEEVLAPVIGLPPRPPDDGSAGRVVGIVAGALVGACILYLLLRRCGSVQEAVRLGALPQRSLHSHSTITQALLVVTNQKPIHDAAS